MMLWSIISLIYATLETNQSFIIKIQFRDELAMLSVTKKNLEDFGFLNRLQLENEYDEKIVDFGDINRRDYEIITKILESTFKYQISSDKFINVAVIAEFLEIRDIENISIYLTTQIQYNEEYLNIFKELASTIKCYQDRDTKYVRSLFFWTAKKIAEEFECSLIVCKKEISLMNSKNLSELTLIDAKNNFTIKLPIHILKDGFLKFINFEKRNNKNAHICPKYITNKICILNICLHALVLLVNHAEFTPTELNVCGSNKKYFNASCLNLYIESNFLKVEWFLTIRSIKFLNSLLFQGTEFIFRYFENLHSITINESNVDSAFIFNLLCICELPKGICLIQIYNITILDKEIALSDTSVGLIMFSFKFLDPMNGFLFRNLSFLSKSKEFLVGIEFNINEKYNLENLKCINEFKLLKYISLTIALRNVSKILNLLNIINEWLLTLEFRGILIEIIQGIFTTKNFDFSKQTSLQNLTLIGIIIDANFFNISNQTKVEIESGWVMEFKNSENIFDKNIVMFNTLFSQNRMLITNFIKIFMLQTRLRGLSIDFNDLNLGVGKTTFNFTSILFLKIYNYNEHTNKRAQTFFKAVKFTAPQIIEIFNSDNLPQLFEFLVLSNLTTLTYVDCNVNGSILPNKDQLEKCPVKQITIKSKNSISSEDAIIISQLCMLYKLELLGHITPKSIMLSLKTRREFIENLQRFSFVPETLTYIE